MASKKNEQAGIPAEEREMLKAELKAEIEAEARAEIEAETRAEMKARLEAEASAPSSGETGEQKKRAEEKIPYMLPLIEGEPEEVNVTVNGRTIQILRGEQVKIPRMFAEVLDNQAMQMKYLRKYQQEQKEQVTIVE